MCCVMTPTTLFIVAALAGILAFPRVTTGEFQHAHSVDRSMISQTDAEKLSHYNTFSSPRSFGTLLHHMLSLSVKKAYVYLPAAPEPVEPLVDTTKAQRAIVKAPLTLPTPNYEPRASREKAEVCASHATHNSTSPQEWELCFSHHADRSRADPRNIARTTRIITSSHQGLITNRNGTVRFSLVMDAPSAYISANSLSVPTTNDAHVRIEFRTNEEVVVDSTVVRSNNTNGGTNLSAAGATRIVHRIADRETFHSIGGSTGPPLWCSSAFEPENADTVHPILHRTSQHYQTKLPMSTFHCTYEYRFDISDVVPLVNGTGLPPIGFLEAVRASLHIESVPHFNWEGFKTSALSLPVANAFVPAGSPDNREGTWVDTLSIFDPRIFDSVPEGHRARGFRAGIISDAQHPFGVVACASVIAVEPGANALVENAALHPVVRVSSVEARFDFREEVTPSNRFDRQFEIFPDLPLNSACVVFPIPDRIPVHTFWGVSDIRVQASHTLSSEFTQARDPVIDEITFNATEAFDGIDARNLLVCSGSPMEGEKRELSCTAAFSPLHCPHNGSAVGAGTSVASLQLHLCENAEGTKGCVPVVFGGSADDIITRYRPTSSPATVSNQVQPMRMKFTTGVDVPSAMVASPKAPFLRIRVTLPEFPNTPRCVAQAKLIRVRARETFEEPQRSLQTPPKPLSYPSPVTFNEDSSAPLLTPRTTYGTRTPSLVTPQHIPNSYPITSAHGIINHNKTIDVGIVMYASDRINSTGSYTAVCTRNEPENDPSPPQFSQTCHRGPFEPLLADTFPLQLLSWPAPLTFPIAARCDSPSVLTTPMASYNKNHSCIGPNGEKHFMTPHAITIVDPRTKIPTGIIVNPHEHIAIKAHEVSNSTNSTPEQIERDEIADARKRSETFYQFNQILAICIGTLLPAILAIALWYGHPPPKRNKGPHRTDL